MRGSLENVPLKQKILQPPTELILTAGNSRYLSGAPLRDITRKVFLYGKYSKRRTGFLD
jgi:hypothetical protein